MDKLKKVGDTIAYVRGMVGHKLVFMPAACACIADEEGRLLLQKRPSGKWGLPGGICELGETAAESAVREVYEETGLEVNVTELIGVYSGYQVVCANGDELQPVVTLFRAVITGGELKADGGETLELRYFSQDELPEIYCRQHEDMTADFFTGKTGIYR